MNTEYCTLHCTLPSRLPKKEETTQKKHTQYIHSADKSSNTIEPRSNIELTFEQFEIDISKISIC